MEANARVQELLGAAHELANEAATAEVFAALSAAGLDAILLKGPSIASRLYAGPAERPSADVDLLVEPAREPEAAAVLRSLGYERPTISYARDFSGGQMWVRSDGALPLDLHSRLAFVRAEPQAAFEILRSRAVDLEVGGRPLRVFDPAAMALHLCIQAVIDRDSDGRREEDLCRACERLPRSAWIEAADLARELRATDALAGGLRSIEPGDRLADELGLPRHTGIAVGMCLRGMPELGTGLLTLTASGGFAPGARQALRLLMPSPERQRARWRIARAGTVGLVASYALWPLYLAVRLPLLALAAGRELVSPVASRRQSSPN